MSFIQKALSRPVGLATLTADTLGDWFWIRCYRTEDELAITTVRAQRGAHDVFTTDTTWKKRSRECGIEDVPRRLARPFLPEPANMGPDFLNVLGYFVVHDPISCSEISRYYRARRVPKHFCRRLRLLRKGFRGKFNDKGLFSPEEWRLFLEP